jgi:hypothetical protein
MRGTGVERRGGERGREGTERASGETLGDERRRGERVEEV